VWPQAIEQRRDGGRAGGLTQYGLFPILFEMSFDPATHIRQLREELGWTQEDLAKRARIDQGDLSRIERGGIDPRWSTVNRIINALGETFSLTSAPTTIRRALTAETRENIRKTARSGAAKRRTLGEAALPIKR
jgi:transcriptional regulator with XRE-family HTH domain